MKPSNRLQHKKGKTTNLQGTDPINYLHAIIILCYAFIAVVTPNMNTLDSNGPKFFTLAILNLVAYPVMLLVNRHKPLRGFHSDFFKTRIGVAYMVFMLFSLLSFFKAFNIYESVINFAKVITIFIAAFNVANILRSDKRFVYLLSVSMSLLLLIDSFTVFYHVATSLLEGKGPNIPLIKSIYSNKNILSAALFVKLAFVLWLVSFGKRWMKFLGGATLFFAFIALLFMSTRAFYVGSIAIFFVYLGFLIIRYSRNQQKRKVLNIAGAAILALIILITVFSSIVNHLYPNPSQAGYLDFFARLKTIGEYEGSRWGYGGRTAYWIKSLELAKENPLLGIGTGNWKIEMLKYETPITGAYIQMYKNHNDFIENYTDIGFIGGTAFIAIFLIVYYNFIRAFFRKGKQKEPEEGYKWLFLPAFGLFCYSFDAFFNFPHDRPEIISFFAIFVGAGVAYSPTINHWAFRRRRNPETDRRAVADDAPGVSQSGSLESVVSQPMAHTAQTLRNEQKRGAKHEHKGQNAPKAHTAPAAGQGTATPAGKNKSAGGNLSALPIIVLFLAMLLGSVYVFYLNFKSLKLQRIIKQELLTGTLTTKSEVFTQGFPMIPDISIEGEPIAVSKARYLVSEARYREAIDLLKKDNASPYDTRPEFFIAISYLNMGKLDSSLLYSRKVYAMKPLFPGNVTVLCNALEAKGDIEEALRILNEHAALVRESNENVSDNIRQKIAQLTPMVKIKPYEQLYTKALNAFTQKDYKAAIRYFNEFIAKEPGVAAAFEYRAFSHFYLNDFRSSLADIEQAIVLDPSKPGFINLRGICKHFLGDDPAACADFQTAIGMGDKDAPVNYERFCRKKG